MTVLFADLAGSTSMQEQLDAEATARIMERIYALLATAVENESGRVVKSTGDGIMAVFGVPVLREDDALRAVRAGLAMHASFNTLRHELAHGAGITVGLRVGVNTGEVVVSPDDDDVVGDPVNVAARLESAAGLGDVFIGPETQRATRDRVILDDVEPLQLKGKRKPVTAARVVAVKEAATADTPFLGRETDLAELQSGFEAAVTGGAARLVTVLGFAGLGKSRLGAELVARLAHRARVVEARFVRDGASSFGPIADALRRSVDIGTLDLGEDRERVAATLDALLTGTSPGSTEQVFWAIRRLLETASGNGPVVVVLDDLHWAEPAMLDLVEHLAEWLRGGPVLLLALARPELRDVRPSFVEVGGPSHAVVALGGLGPDACRRLVLDVLDARSIPDAVVRRLLDASEGNPLFLRELVRLLVDDGVLRRDDDAWRLAVDIESIELPATIHAALAARIEQLSDEEREVLEVASVIGRHFARGAVAALLPAILAAGLDGHLASLHRRSLVDPEGTWWEDERLYRFHHVLIRDVAYRRVLKEVRADLHVRYADWLTARAGDAVGEHDETLGHHLEQAVTYRRELGQPIEPSLVERGVRHLSAAGRRALDADDLANAASLLGRAVGLGHGEAELLRDWCEAVVSGGDVSAAEEAVAALAAGARDDRGRALADVYSAQLAAQQTPDAVRDVATRAAAAATTLAAHGDDAGVAKAESVHASALLGLGRVGAAEVALDCALAAARRAGDRRRANDVLALAPRAALWGPSPIARASGRCLDVVRVLRITSWAPHVEAQALRCQAVLEAMRDRPDAARRMLDNARSTFTDLGHRIGLLDTATFAGLVELLADEPVTAEGHLREALAGYELLGVRVGAARAAALLARALLELGRTDEAEALADPALAGDDLKASIGLLGVRAEVLARRSDLADAEQLARAAAALAEPTDALVDHADARLALARVLATAGRSAEADAELRRARSLYEQKGAVVGVRRCGSLTADDARSHAGPAETARRVDPNLATAAGEAISRDVAAGDEAALATRHSPDSVVYLHHLGTEVNRDEQLAEIARAVNDRAVITPKFLATLGERHALVRRRTVRPGGIDVGEVERIVVLRTDEHGVVVRNDVFPDDERDLAEALGCLVQRWAETEATGSQRERAQVLARCYGLATAAFTAGAWDDYADIFEPDCTVVDHRNSDLEIRGRDQIVGWVRSLAERAERMEGRIADVLALTPEASLWQWESTGEAGGGPFVLPALIAVRVGVSGRFDRLEFFSPDALDDALACFDRYDSARRRRIASNLVVEVGEAWDRAGREGDAEALGALYTPDFVFEDHTLHAGEEVSFHVRRLADAFDEVVAVHNEFVATLGDRHAVWRALSSMRSTGDVDLVERELICAGSVTPDGRLRRIDAFREDALGAAVACMVEHWADDELPPSQRERAAAMAAAWRIDDTIRAHDWDAYAACFDDGVVLVDHRTTGLDVHGVVANTDWLRELIGSTERFETDLVDVLAMTPRAALWVRETTGEWETGGSFDMPSLNAVRLGPSGRIDRLEFFRPDDAELAWSTFEAFDTARRRRVVPNGSSAAMQRWVAARRAGDAASAAALRPPEWVLEDHVFLGRLDADQQSDREGDLKEAVVVEELIATLGERQSLHRLQVDRDDAVRDYLVANQAGPGGRSELFPVDQLEESMACLVSMWREDEASSEGSSTGGAVWDLNAAVNARDWDAVRGLLPSQVTLADHRPTAAGEIRGPDAVVEWYQGIVEVTDGLVIRTIDVLACAPEAVLVETLAHGDASGAPVEMRSLVVSRLDGTRHDIFPPEKIDEAWACFDRLTARDPEPPRRRIRPNAATATVERMADGYRRRDAAALADLYAPDFVSASLSPRTKTTLAEHLERQQELLTTASVEVEAITSLGERHGLARFAIRWPEVDGSGQIERERFYVGAVDAMGRFRRFDSFGAAELREALACLVERWAEDEVDGHARQRALMQAETLDVFRAIGATDWERCAELFAPGVVVVDGRVEGVGEITGRDAVLEWLQYGSEKTDGLRYVLGDVLDVTTEGSVLGSTLSGVIGGGSFEIPVVIATKVDDEGLVARFEIFPDSDAAQALARFDEMTRPHPARRFTPNLASEAVLAWQDGIHRSDQALLESLADGGYVWASEPLHMSPTVVDAQSVRVIPNGARTDVDIVATLGRRHAAYRVRASWRDEATGADVDWSGLYVVRVSDDRKFRRIDCFELDQLPDGLACLAERWAEDEANPAERVLATGMATGCAAFRHHTAGDWEAFGVNLADDVVVVDRRPTSAGEVAGREAVVTFFRAFHEQSDEFRSVAEDVLAFDARGAVIKGRSIGRAAGEPFEWPSLMVLHIRSDGRADRIESFPIEAIDQALARYDELHPVEETTTRRIVRPNLATANVDRWLAATRSADHEGVARSCAAQYVWEDHDLRVALSEPQQRRYVGDAGLFGLDVEILATLGERHLLQRVRAAQEAVGVADQLLVFRVDREGRGLRTDKYDGGRLGDALVCLVERWAEDELVGPARGRGTQLAGCWRSDAATSAGDWSTMRGLYAGDVVLVDHRTTSAGEVRGADAVVEWAKAFADSVDEMRAEYTDVLAVTPDASVSAWRFSGHLDGAPWESRALMVVGFDVRGAMSSIDAFEQHQVDEALARFQELTARPRRRIRTNAATGIVERWAAAVNTGLDPSAVIPQHPGYDRVFHRYHAALDAESAAGGDRNLLGATAVEVETLATMGEGHALSRVRLHDLAVGADSWTESLSVTRSSEDGVSALRDDVFPGEDLPGALACLVERWAELELDERGRARAARLAEVVRGVETLVAADWEAYGALYAEEAVFVDRRPTGMGEVRGRAGIVDWNRGFWSLAEDIDGRMLDVLGLTPTTALVQFGFRGEAGGVAFETMPLTVLHVDDDGLVDRHENFDPEQLDAAWARFDELTAPPHRRVEQNLATEALARWDAAARSRDTGATSSLYAPGHRITRHDQHLAVEREAYLARERELVERGSFRVEALASLGQRHALHRDEVEWDEDGEGQTVSMCVLGVSRVDEDGRFLHDDVLPAEHLHRGISLLFERWAEEELDGAERARAMQVAAQLRFPDLVASRDWDRYRALFTEDSVQVDHRPISAGEMRGADALVAWIRELDTVAGLVTVTYEDVLALTPTAILWRNLASTDTEAGTVHWPSLVAARWASNGLLERSELFPVEDSDAAWACFERFAAEPAVAEPAVAESAVADNAAVRLLRQWADAIAAGDASAATALQSPWTITDDRRALVGARAVGPDQAAQQNDAIVDAGITRVEVDPIAVHDDGLALVRLRFHSSSGDLTEILNVSRSDSTGWLSGGVVFAPDQRDEAMTEFNALAGIDGHPAVNNVRRWAVAISSGDVDAANETFVPGAVADDRRRLVQTRSPVEVVNARLAEMMRPADVEVSVLPLVVRGSSSALVRVVVEEKHASIDLLSVVQTDEDGLRAALAVIFDSDDIEAALAELDKVAPLHDCTSATMPARRQGKDEHGEQSDLRRR